MYLHNIPDSISFLSILFHPKYYQFISSWRFHTQACSRRSTTQLMSGKIKLNDSSDSDVINTSLYYLPESATFDSEGNIKSHAEFIVWYSSYFSNAKCTSFKEHFRVCMTLFRNRSKTIFLERKLKSLKIITVSNRKKCISCNKGYGGCVLNISNI